MIKVVLGLVEVTSGTGEVLGLPLATDKRVIRSRVGYMPEDDCYIPGLSGVEMVQFVARLSGHPAIEALRRTHQILDYCGVAQERYRDLATCSTGLRQKLKFAQAIVHDPPLLILDEPTAGLDPDERLAMLNRIRSLSTESGKVVVVSTHILPDVQSMCDSVVIMVRGEIRLVERLDVLSRPTAPAWHLRVLGSAEPLVERIRSAGFAADIDNLGRITVRGVDDDGIRLVWQWAAEVGVSLRSLRSAQNSLEDVFLSAIEENSVAHS